MSVTDSQMGLWVVRQMLLLVCFGEALVSALVLSHPVRRIRYLE
jgi:hypothetical protein